MKIVRCLYKLLFIDTPTYLAALLLDYWKKDILSKTSEELQSLDGQVVQCYDVIDCKEGNRYVVATTDQSSCIVHNSGQFKAGPRRQWRMLRLEGYDLSLDTVKGMNESFWGEEMFRGVVKWEEELLAEVDFNGGWMYNGLGRPFAVMQHKRKDVINIQSQSTGHEILDLWNYYLSVIVFEEDLNAMPLVEDWHDERVWWAPTIEDANKLKDAMDRSTAKLNEHLGGSIPFKAEVEIAKCFSDFKEPDDWLLT